MKKNILLFLLFSFATSVNAQKSDHALLLSEFNNENLPDSVRLRAIGTLAWDFRSNNPDSAIFYANKQLQFSLKQKNLNWAGKALNTLGKAYDNKNSFSQSLKCYFLAVDILQLIKDDKGVQICYGNIGVVYQNQNNFAKALEYFLKSLKQAEENNYLKGQSVMAVNIGLLYSDNAEYDKALEYYLKALEMKKALKDTLGLAICYGNMGIVYKNKKNFPMALEYQLKSLDLSNAVDDQMIAARALASIGTLYGQQKNYQKALEYHQKSIAVKRKLGNARALAHDYLGLSSANNKLGNYDQGHRYADSALVLSKKIGDQKNESSAYRNLSEAYYGKNDLRNAYLNRVKYENLNDSIFNIDNTKQLSDLKTNFEVDKKAAELKIKSDLEKEKLRAIAGEEQKRQNIIILCVAVTLLIVLFFSFFLYKRYKVTQLQKNVISDQKNLVELQKLETEKQKEIIEEKQKEILDSITYAKRIQSAILPPEAHIKEFIPESFIYYQPKDIVAGDFYWMEHIDGDTFIAAADSTGHGVPGALVSVVCSNALNRSVKEFNLKNTGRILDKTRELVLETFAKSGTEIKDGMDISLLKIHAGRKTTVEWSGANNPLWYIVPEGNLIEVKANKQPIGKADNPTPFSAHTISFESGTTFFLFTDGYPDQFGGEKGKKFKYKQLEDLLIGIHNTEMKEQSAVLEDRFNKWKGNQEQVDDVTLIGIKL